MSHSWLPGIIMVQPFSAVEVVDGQHHADAERRARTRHLVEAVVGVQRLRRLAGIDADRLGRAEQEVRLQEAADQGEQPLVGGKSLKDAAAAHQRVDAFGRKAFETVAAAMLAEMRLSVPRVPAPALPTSTKSSMMV